MGAKLPRTVRTVRRVRQTLTRYTNPWLGKRTGSCLHCPSTAWEFVDDIDIQPGSSLDIVGHGAAKQPTGSLCLFSIQTGKYRQYISAKRDQTARFSLAPNSLSSWPSHICKEAIGRKAPPQVPGVLDPGKRRQ